MNKAIIIHESVFNKYLLCLLTIFPFFEPRIFFNYPSFASIDKIYLIFQVTVFLCVMIQYISYNHYSIGFLGIILFRVSILINTFLASGMIDKGWFSKTIIIVGAAAAIELYLRKDCVMLLQCLYFVLFVPLMINCVMCLFRISFILDGTEYFFIGMRTQFPNTMFVCITISFLLSYLKSNALITKMSVITLIVCLIQLIAQWVGTGILLMLILIGMLLYVKVNRQQSKALNAPLLIVCGLLIGYLIVFVRIQNLFAFIIEGVLHKDMTFTGRTSIWDYAIESFYNKPFIGYGELGTGGFVPVYWSSRFAPAHNTVLQLLHDGGVTSLFILVIFMIYAGIILYKNKDYMTSSLLTICIFIICIEMISEVLHYQIYFYLPFILSYNIHYILKTKKMCFFKLFKAKKS